MLLRCTAPIALFFSLAYAGETWPDVLQRSLYSAAAASCEVLENYPDHHYFDQHCPFVFHHVPCTSQELSDRFIGKMRELFGGQSTIDSWTEAAKWRGTETLSTVIGPDNMCCAREVAEDGLGFRYEPTRLRDSWGEYCAKYHIAYPREEM